MPQPANIVRRAQAATAACMARRNGNLGPSLSRMQYVYSDRKAIDYNGYYDEFNLTVPEFIKQRLDEVLGV